MKSFVMMCTVALLAGCTAANNNEIEQQVDELYGKMSQEERIAQLRSM
jgi:beta-glucosidase